MSVNVLVLYVYHQGLPSLFTLQQRQLFVCLRDLLTKSSQSKKNTRNARNAPISVTRDIMRNIQDSEVDTETR